MKRPTLLNLMLMILALCTLINAQISKNGPSELLSNSFYYEELYLNGKSPGFVYETILPTTMMNGTLYGGTYPHGHIVKILPTTDSTAVTQDLWVTEGTDVRYIYTLTNEDDYLYGAASINPLLFCYKPGTSEKLAFGQSGLVAESISLIYDATVYTNPNGEKFVYYTTHNGKADNQLKLIRWKISEGGEPVYFDCLTDIIKINNPNPSRIGFGNSDHIELGTYSDPASPDWSGTPKKVLYVNTGNNMLVIYGLDNGKIKIIDNLNISSDEDNYVRSIASEVNIPNILWLFTGKGGVIRYNVKDKSFINYTSSFSGWVSNPERSYPINSNGFIYTHCGKIKTDLASGVAFYPYKNNAFVNNMNISLHNNNLYSAYSYAMNTGIHYEITGVTGLTPSPVKLRSVSPPSTRLMPSGGGIITGLSAYNRTVRASYSIGAVEQTYNPSLPDWDLRTINFSQTYNGMGGVQADKIVEKYGYVFYGIYARPFLRIRSTGTDSSDQIINLQAVINDTNQVRLNGIEFISDKYLILSTSSSTAVLNTSPCLLAFDLEKFRTDKQLTIDKFKKIGVIKSTNPAAVLSSIGSVVLKETADSVVIYGTSHYQLFMAKYAKSELKTLASPKQIMAVTDNTGNEYTAMIMDNSGHIFCFVSKAMLSIPVQNITCAADMMFSGPKTTKYNSYLLPETGAVVKIPSVEGYCYSLVKANDGNLYGSVTGHIFQFNPDDPGIHPTYYPIPGFSASNLQLEVHSLANDPTSNVSIYAGTVSGKIFKLTNEELSKKRGVRSELTAPKERTFKLNNNYPNPFNPETRIGYSIDQEGMVSLKVYDMLGREIRVLVDSRQGAGDYEVSFNAADLPSGFYIYQLKAGKKCLTQKMLLVK